MEQSTERKLLYYERFKMMQRHYNGAPIFHFMCKDVKTGEDVILGSCIYSQEVSEALGGHYYSQITDVANDFDILWSLSDEQISPVASNFEEVQVEYRRMLSEGVSQEEINSAMVIFFQNKNKSKCL